MKCSESWLREWVDFKLDLKALCHLLTMSGFEVEDIAPVSQEFTEVVVGKIEAVEKHPNADQLTVCRVSIGKSVLSIVCGAQNVKKGLKVAVAKVGAKLGAIAIKMVNMRGVESHGMICSAKELGLDEDHSGVLELADDAPIGKDLRKYLSLNDCVMDIAITPNRGDCLSIQGISREVAALTQDKLTPVKIVRQPISIKTRKRLKVSAKGGCPNYVGRIITGVKADIPTPLWLKEKLRRVGQRSINPIVDIMNYVMLELGQPLHAFDNDKIGDDIFVRFSKSGEEVTLLDASHQRLDDKTLVIADKKNVLAMAGLMGGLDSSITLNTTAIFLESAYFDSKTIARSKQYYNIQSDAAYRYERGVDPLLQQKALERATQLILEIVGGKAGPIVQAIEKKLLPKAKVIKLSDHEVNALIGVEISHKKIADILKRLHFACSALGRNALSVKAPSFRFDIAYPEDLIEEIARIYGYDKIPAELNRGELMPARSSQLDLITQFLRDSFSQRAFSEVITYSFIEASLQKLFDPQQTPIALSNPISADMGVMRTTLLPGLINVLRYNLHRQQDSIKIFEIANCFLKRNDQPPEEILRIAGLMAGPLAKAQWGLPARDLDFFDLKGELQILFTALHLKDELKFIAPAPGLALHPGQSAQIFLANQPLGCIGQLHPAIAQKLDFKNRVYVFEIDIGPLIRSKFVHYQPISKFPEIRRDIALLVKQTIPAEIIQDTIKKSAGSWLKDVFIFDVYQGKGIASGYKSVAIGVILQHPDRTLIDEEVASLMDTVVRALKEQIGAELRS